MNGSVAILLLLSACNFRDEFAAPQVTAPEHFKNEGKWVEAAPAEAVEKGKWWQVFADEKLNQLQEDLQKNNNDLAAAAARLEQYSKQKTFKKSAQLPTISGFSGANRQKTSQNTTNGSFNKNAYSTYNAGLEISYELDIMGKISNNVLAAEKDFESAGAAYNNILLILQANLAENYFALKATNADLDLVHKTIKMREEQTDIIKKREQLGASSGLDVNLASAALAAVKLQALELEKTQSSLQSSLAILMGKAPAEFAINFDIATCNCNFVQPNIPAQLASTVLQRRPDIAAAIKDLEAENARVGAARAAFFPDISLTASGGLQSQQLGDLFNWASRAWVLGPANAVLISGAIYDGGRYFANREAAEAKYAESVANYRQKVLVAFKEVEDALQDRAIIAQQLEQAEIGTTSAAAAEKMTQIKYDAGASSYYDLKTAQLDALAASRQQIATQLQSNLATISFIKAIGGSW